VLPTLFWVFGKECGEVQRVMVDNEISWGTYEDLLAFHCNAHPNNMVLLPKVKMIL